MIKVCEYCNKEIKIKNLQSYGAHKTNCDFNPNRKNILYKIRSVRVERKEYTLICKKCGSEYKIVVSVNDFNKNKYRKTCSDKCANFRIHSTETKLKISESVKKYGNSLSHKGKKLSDDTKNKISDKLKIYYKDNPDKINKKRRVYSDMDKIKLSIQKKEFYRNNPDKHPNRLCAGKKSYWQKILYDELKKSIVTLEYEQKYDNYWMDIVEPILKVDIEYDGKRFHNVEKDAIRDNLLINKGWKIIRISSEELNYRNKENFKNILNKILINLK